MRERRERREIQSICGLNSQTKTQRKTQCEKARRSCSMLLTFAHFSSLLVQVPFVSFYSLLLLINLFDFILCGEGEKVGESGREKNFSNASFARFACFACFAATALKRKNSRCLQSFLFNPPSSGCSSLCRLGHD